MRLTRFLFNPPMVNACLPDGAPVAHIRGSGDRREPFLIDPGGGVVHGLAESLEQHIDLLLGDDQRRTDPDRVHQVADDQAVGLGALGEVAADLARWIEACLAGGIGDQLDTAVQSVRRGLPIELAFTVEENSWNGRTSLQLRAKDLRLEDA